MIHFPVSLMVEGDVLASQDGDYDIGACKVPANDEDHARELLLQWWGEWRAEVEHPDADSEFVVWLIENRNCLAFENELIVVTLPS